MSHKNHLLLELLGWYGTLAILIAYMLNSFSIISATSLTYQLLNLTGSIGIAAIAFSKKDYQPAVLNTIWTIIAIIAIIRYIV